MLPFTAKGESVLDEGETDAVCIPSSARATLLVPYEIAPVRSSERPVAPPRQAVDTMDIRSKITQETARLRQEISTLMSRHEKVIASLLEVHLGRQGIALSTDMTSAANGSEDAGSEHGLDTQFDMDSAAEGHVAKDATLQQAGHSAVKNQEEAGDPNAIHESSRLSFMRHMTPASISHSKIWVAYNTAVREKALKFTEEVPATSVLRAILQNVLKSVLYDSAMALLLLFNCVLIVRETDLSARCHLEGFQDDECIPPWMSTTNFALTSIYTVESIMVLYVKRWHTLREKDRMFDLFVVVVSWIDIILLLLGKNLPSVEILRIVRVTRLLRMSRTLRIFPELRFLVLGFVSAMRAVWWGLLLLMLVLIGASIIAVELVHPVNLELQHDDEFCGEAFQSVAFATLFLFQTIAAGDGWGVCTLPIIKYQPSLLVFLGGTLIAVQTGVLNLIMSVIIDRVAESRENDKITKLKEKEADLEESRQRWTSLFGQLDKDGSGTLMLDELIKGFDELPEFKTDLKLLGLEKDDLSTLLTLMDEDASGSITCDELVTMFDMVHNVDTKMQQVSMGMQLRTVFHHLEHKLFNISKKIDHLCGIAD